jgi:predicted metalloprotease with PDZ domain
VKRIKPNVMVKPDLSKESYTNQLWIYEGFTSFYDDVTLARVGTIPAQKYLDIVAQNISRLLQNAGRFKQSAAESSFDAWTKFYKQDASATNNIVSYYTKGGIISLGLDLLLREQSGDKVCLDDVMRVLWQQYGKDESGTPDNVIQTLCKAHFDIDVSDYLNRVVYHTDDVELEALVQRIGIALRTRAKVSSEDKGGLSLKAPMKRQLGATLKPAQLGLTVAQVFEGLAAMHAGILLNDNIIAINGHVVSQGKLQRILDTTLESTAEVSLIRDGQLLNVTLPVMEARKDMAFFEINDADVFNHWLGVK